MLRSLRPSTSAPLRTASAAAASSSSSSSSSSSFASSSSSRFYATASTKGGKGSDKGSGGKKKEVSRGSRGQETGGGDVRLEVIRKVLFESSPSDEVRLAALAKVVPSAEVHETITRSWALHLRSVRESHAAELAKKYDSMKRAIDLLEATDAELFDKAVGGKRFQNVVQKGSEGNARLEGLIPREFRVPMERPGTTVWDAEWKAPKMK